MIKKFVGVYGFAYTLCFGFPNACAKQSIPFVSPKFFAKYKASSDLLFLSHTLKLNRIIEQFLFLHPSDHKSLFFAGRSR